jgi:hypothetical protein
MNHRNEKERLMKLYIAYDTCSRAAQLVANELGLNPELIHFDVKDKKHVERGRLPQS